MKEPDSANFRNKGSEQSHHHPSFKYSTHFFGEAPRCVITGNPFDVESMEWLSMSSLSTGIVTKSKGDITITQEDLGVPVGNKLSVPTNWEMSERSRPIEDLEKVDRAAHNKGITLKHFIMCTADFMKLRNADNTVAKIETWINNPGKVFLTLELINRYLEASNMPKIIVINPSVKFAFRGHIIQERNPWLPYTVLGITGLRIGDVVIEDNVARPILNNPKAMFYIRTDGAKWPSFPVAHWFLN